MPPAPAARRRVWRLRQAALALACSAFVLAALPAAAVKLRDVPRGDPEATPPSAPDGSGKAKTEAQKPQRRRKPQPAQSRRPARNSEAQREREREQEPLNGLAIGLRASTLGAGVELQYPFNHFVHGRLLFNQLDLNFDRKISGIEYDVDLDLQSYGLIFDLHPFSGNLRLSVGAMLNDNSINAGATTTSSRQVRIGGSNYTGSLALDATFDSFAPYAGIGWGGGNRRGLRLHFDIGAFYQRNPQIKVSGRAGMINTQQQCSFSVNASGAVDITASASCPAALQNTLDTDLKAEFAEIKDDARGFKWYPVLSIGLEYRF